MAYEEGLAERIRTALGPRADLVEKKMFGGICWMVRGHMAAGIVRADLMLRLDPARAAVLLERPGARPMDFTGRPMPGMLYVSEEGFPTDAALAEWVGEAVRFAESQPVKPPKPPKAKAPKARGPKAPR